MHSMRKFAVGMTSLIGLAARLTTSPQAAATPCTGGFFRTYDYTNHVSAIGINSQLTTPTSTQVWGYASGMPSAGDIGLLSYSTNEFVQYGRYVGSPSGCHIRLPFVCSLARVPLPAGPLGWANTILGGNCSSMST